MRGFIYKRGDQTFIYRWPSHSAPADVASLLLNAVLTQQLKEQLTDTEAAVVWAGLRAAIYCTTG